MRHTAGVALVALVALAAGRAGAQPNAVTVVRVHVTDSTGAPVRDADVAIVRGLQDVVVRGVTDSAGRRMLSASLARGDYEVVVRRIGFTRVGRFFSAHGDTLSVDIVAARSPQALDAVTVRAKEDVRRRSYFVDAEAIANSQRPLRDATDVVTTLRPDMIYGRGGAELCGPVRNVWINGTRIVFPFLNPAAVAERRMALRASRATPHLAPQGRGALPASVVSILATIRPEHIEEMRFHDCGDLSLGRPNSERALFIVLKAGVAYRPNRGSYVVAVEAATGAMAAPSATAAATTAALAVDSLPRHRFRLIGVFDDDTGHPVEGADVLDVRTGWKATTSATGAASLFFLPEGASTVRLTRTGYRTLELSVTISPADTVPITLLLTRLR